MRYHKSSVEQLTLLGRPGVLLLTIFFCVVSFLALPERAGAQPRLGWIPFDESSPEQKASRSNMKDETTTGMLINFDVPGMYVHEVEVDDSIYQRLSIPGKAASTVVGKPEVPIVGTIIEVPFDIDLEVEIVKSKYRILKDYNIYPAQEPAIDHKDWQRGEFKKDTTTYKTNAFYPMKLADIKREDFAIMRGHRIVLIKVSPVQYNPVTKEMRVYSNLEVRLHYSRPSQIKRIDKRLISPAFEELLEASLLNYKKLERFDWHDYYDEKEKKYRDLKLFKEYNLFDGGYDNPGSNGCDYLIVSHGDFYNENDPNNPVVRLRNWKRQKGLVTEVVTLADIPDSDNDGTIDTLDIRDYIQDIYDAWSPPPTYIIFIGDVGDNAGNLFIPTFYRTVHPAPAGINHNGTRIATDLYYFTVDGNDYFPDIFFGRLSVDNVGQATDVIDKILAYEQNPPPQANNAFYTDASLVALFEDVTPDPPGVVLGDGTEDRPWIEVVEEIWQYLNNNGYNPERIYNTSGVNVNPQFYQDGVNQPPAGIPWNGGQVDISNAINPGPANDGRFLVVYRDHGAQDGWSEPSFDNGDVDNLANGNLTPVVFSLACQTGWFDNESDDDANLPAGEVTADADECFCEHFLRNNNGGAVSIIGATRNSATGFNDFLLFGMIKAIWPDFDPNPPLTANYPAIPDRVTSPIPRMGQICTFGKVFMANAYGHTDVREATFEFYHVFGDPEMPIWSEEPAVFHVDYPIRIGSTGLQDFVVEVSDNAGDPVASAVVSLTDEGEIVSTRLTDAGGVARFTRNFDATTLDITVTALSYRPYIDTIKVTDDGAVVNRLNPEDGAEGSPFNIGGRFFSGDEQVDISLNYQWMKTHQASGGEFGQSGVEDVSITIPHGHEHGLFNVVAMGQTSGRTAVDVFQVRDPNPVDLYTYSQWDNTTWHLHAGGNPTWNNPEIQLYDINGNPVASNNLIVGNQYTIRATIYNNTNFAANNATVTFKWANYATGQPVFYDINVDNINVAGNSSADAEVTWTPASTGHTCIKVEIYHVEDIYTSNNSGQENCHVGPTASPATIPLTVYNPTENPAAVYFELRQLYQSNPAKAGPFWKTRIKHPDPQVIPPEGETKAEAVFDPDWTYIEAGKEAEFALTGFINDQMIGGVNMIVFRKLRPWLISAHVGYPVPFSIFADYYDPSFSVFVDFGYNISSRLSLVGLFGYNGFKAEDPATMEDTYWLNLNIDVQYRMPIINRISSYLRGGPGYYIPKTGDNKYGFNTGLGLFFHLNNSLTLDLGIDYHRIIEGMDVYGLAPPPTDENIQFYIIHAGVVFNF